jgi:hypothetical protein
MRVLPVRRYWKRILGFGGVLAVAAIFYAVYFHAVVGPILERYHARRALASASPPELDKVAGPLGRVFRFADSSWVAIRYADSHASPGWSLAIARDSTGKWFESKEHFCGSFVIIQDIDEINRQLGDVPPVPADPPANRVEWIRLLAASPDLKTARERLTSSYFVETQ